METNDTPTSPNVESITPQNDTGNMSNHGWIVWIVLLLSIISTIFVCYLVPGQYKEVIQKSNVHVSINVLEGIECTKDYPVWFRITGDTITTNRALDRVDVIELKTLVNDTCKYYGDYSRAIGELAYKSNNDTSNIYNLAWLTFFFVFLGCSVRTFFDFIGHYCYLKDLNMNNWWPWYCLRPVICAPVTAILIVSIHTSFFSNLFISKDLNTYLVISFLAGFAVMEFLRMLRHVSKSIFYVEGNTENKSNSQK